MWLFIGGYLLGGTMGVFVASLLRLSDSDIHKHHYNPDRDYL